MKIIEIIKELNKSYINRKIIKQNVRLIKQVEYELVLVNYLANEFLLHFFLNIYLDSYKHT